MKNRLEEKGKKKTKDNNNSRLIVQTQNFASPPRNLETLKLKIL